MTQKITGSQRFAFEVTKQLVEIYGSNNICILVPKGKLDDGYQIANLPIKAIGKFNSVLWEQIDLPIFMYRNGACVLINLVNTAPIMYKNQFVSILDMATFVNPQWFSKAFRYYYKIILPIIAKRSKRIITISECSKNDIVRLLHVPESKVVIIYCGVADLFSAEGEIPSYNDAYINKLNIKKNGFLLAVSSLEPRKNFIRLVKAYNEITVNVPPLVIVGSEGKVFANDELREVIGKSKNIILTGYITDEELAVLYRSAFCFIYPSLYEGFGMPPLEAMACNCPTVVSNSSSIPEVCGNASIYIDPLNIESIKNAILQLIENPEMRFGLIEEGAKQTKKFTWVKTGERLKGFIDELQQSVIK